jgi:hypothetical protein
MQSHRTSHRRRSRALKNTLRRFRRDEDGASETSRIKPALRAWCSSAAPRAGEGRSGPSRIALKYCFKNDLEKFPTLLLTAPRMIITLPPVAALSPEVFPAAAGGDPLGAVNLTQIDPQMGGRGLRQRPPIASAGGGFLSSRTVAA